MPISEELGWSVNKAWLDFISYKHGNRKNQVKHGQGKTLHFSDVLINTDGRKKCGRKIDSVIFLVKLSEMYTFKAFEKGQFASRKVLLKYLLSL